MKSNCYPKYAVGFVSVKTFCVWGILFAFRNVIFFDVNKQLFKYSVNSAILFSKSFWTRFTRLTSWHILCFTWRPRSPSSLLKMLVPPRKRILPLGNGSIDPFINFGTPSFIFFNPLSFTSYPKRLELQVPPNWDFGGWIALWYEMHIFQRCRHRQTDLVTTGPFHKNFGLKW